jgi:TldD protein
MTNTVMLAGDADPQEIIASVKEGSLRGELRRRAGRHHLRQVRVLLHRGLLIENGKIAAPVKGATLIGNGPDVMTKVKMIGNDMKLDPASAPAARKARVSPSASASPPC